MPNSKAIVRATGNVSPLLALAISGGAVLASGLLARRSAPEPQHPDIQRWYHHLDKPDFVPPDPVFGAVWGVLESLLAYGGYRLLRHPATPTRNRALGLWGFNIAMISVWPRLFFGERSVRSGFLGSLLMLGSGIAYVASARRVDKVVAATSLPFAAWLGFASVVSEEVWRRNED
ncbi:TspO and MBR related proteins [Faunimonas pinastri]|uniref:TspO and MBR related proteins n=1 Tax=Faunimonas pinastri TaxID=1855383 RepID=A0A1H9HGE8_9HYPH|nr:TspO/MBR family protein [Faunimonas pinastri]SEQ61354.1 TspO and MBR related proteins [Faunimonas pinastri]